MDYVAAEASVFHNKKHDILLNFRKKYKINKTSYTPVVKKSI
jgi:hypothetical protein